MQVVVATLFAALAVAFWVFQVAQHQKFDEMAENNHRRRLPLPAPRGVLFDRNGKVLVENQNTFNIALDREQSGNIDDTLAPARGGHRRRRSDDARDGQPPPSRAELSADRAGRERDHGAGHRGSRRAASSCPASSRRKCRRASIRRARWRRISSATSSEASEADLAQPEYAGAESGSMVGKAGVEQSYNKLLMGKDGDRLVVVNSRGREMDEAQQSAARSKAGASS